MSTLISRSEIVEALRQWQDGAKTSKELYEWVQSIYWPSEIEFEDQEDSDVSVSNEVLSVLDQLPGNLALPIDAPVYLKFLETSAGDFNAGYAHFNEALDRIDYAKRREILKNDPFFAPFCTPPK